MTKVSIKIDKNLEGMVVSALGEVIGEDGQTVFRGAVPVGYNAVPLSLTLDPGLYVVRVTFPSGEVLTESCEVTGKATPVHLRGSESQHEWLSWHEFAFGQGAGRREPFEESRYMRRVTLRDEISRPESGEVPVFAVTMPDGTDFTETVPLPGGRIHLGKQQFDVKTESDENYLLVRVSAVPGGKNWIRPQEWPRIYICASAPGAQIRFVALPLPWPNPEGNHEQREVEVLLRRREGADDPSDGSGAIASLLVRDEMFGALLSFLAEGDPGAASVIGHSLYSEAEYMLWNKMNNPYAAAVGGYVLIRSKEVTQFPDWFEWPRNLANRFEWLPDGAVIYGWQQLLLETPESLRNAREYLIEATQRGVPVFTDGVRLLIRGIARLRQYDGFDDDGELDAAAAIAGKFGASVDPTMPFSTIADSDSLGLGKRFGLARTVSPVEVAALERESVGAGASVRRKEEYA